jgi:tetratricopeptide (TPR) repeat protein
MQALLCPACGAAHSEFDSRCASCGASLPSSSETRTEGGDLLAGRQVSHFRILERIGGGGMGVVYRALDVDLGREVALKFLHPHREAASHGQLRFRREAQAAAALDHPNIGTIYEVGEREGRDFIAMALYEGETLGRRLAARPDHRLPASEAAAIAGQLASALAAAHAAGVVHRDLKPENVMVLADGRVKLLDFGLARWVGSPGLTEQGVAVGTAAFMAPEQLRGEEAGPAADVWALGVVLHEMLAGGHPFGGERQGMMHAILFEDFLPLREARPDAPEALERIVVRSLAKDPRERWSAGEILTALQAAGLWGSGTLTGALVPIAPSSPPPARSRRGFLAAGVALALAALGLAAYFGLRKPPPPVYVAVLRPAVAGSLAAEDQARVGANLQAALLRTVASLDGLAALDSAKVNPVQGSPAAVARAVAAGEVVTSGADCAGDLCHVSLSRLSGADGRVLWTEALEIPSTRPRLFADAVAAALRQGYGDRRLRVQRLELEIEERDYRAFLDLKRRLAQEGASDGALDRLDDIRKSAPSFVEAYSQEAKVARRLYLETGEPRYLSRGLAVAREGLRLAPGDPRPLEALFELELSAGRLDDAEATLGRLEEIDPAGSLLQRGLLAERRGRPQEALELMRAAIRLQPSWLTLLTVANAEYRMNRIDDARHHLEELLARSPGNVDGLKTLAQIELLRHPERAVALLRAAARSDPGPASLTNLGVALLLLRRYSEAESSLRQALALQPDDPDATLNLADCLALLGRATEARRLYVRLADVATRRATPSDWNLLSVEAQALAHLGETERALDAIQQALRLSPDNGQLAYEAAVVYVLVGDRGSALFHARRAAAQKVDANWFALPFFDPLRNEPAFQALARTPR